MYASPGSHRQPAAMDYAHAGYYAPPVQQYPYYGVPAKLGHQYTAQEEHPNDPAEAYSDPNAFVGFDQSFTFPHQPMISQPQSPPHSINPLPVSQPYPRENSLDMPADFEIYEQGQGRSSDDEKDNLTPAQSRRKAQNRAAQRAFRERKERHVKDLEGKLNSVTTQNNSLLAEVERLQRENEKFAHQYEVLRATRAPINQSGGRTESPIAGPLHYGVDSFTHHVASPHSDTSSQHDRTVPPASHRIQVSSTGERLYGVGATWDFIQNHELFRKGMVDITEISQRIQSHAVCDGAGPAYPESEIIKAIEDSVSGAGDELI